MTKSISLILGATVVSMVAGCSTTPMVLGTVGPSPASATAQADQGYLKVHTATEDPGDGGEPNYYPHTSYSIYTESGSLWKSILNHVGTMDESPMLVRLPIGRYKVVGKADGYGQVAVPVIIKPGRVTEVNLEILGRAKPAVVDEAAVVQLPNGCVVGWRAELAEDSKK